jgi:hypothetical protein
MVEILVESHIDKIVMPENLKVGLMIAEQRKKRFNLESTGIHLPFWELKWTQKDVKLEFN